MTSNMTSGWQTDGNEEFSQRFDSGSTLTDERTNGLTDDLQDQGLNRRVLNAPNPVDNDVLITREDLLRTRVVLAQLAGEQERLSAELNTTGLTDFADRADWLIAHRTPDEQLAWRRHWRRLGFSDPEPRRERFPRSSSLAVPVAPKRRRKPAPVIPVDRQLEIALQVLAEQEAA